MATHIAISVPLSRIQRIQNYINTRGKALATILRETGADYAINGTLYDMRSGRIVCHLKADGEVLASPPYTVTGYAWDTGPDIIMDALPDNSRNYVACTPLIVSGKPLDKLVYDKGQGGRRGRSAIGLKAGRLCLYCSKDGSSEARTPEKLRDLLQSYGWTSAVMLDGGGSSQCDFDGERITSRRIVRHLILVYLKKNNGEENEPEGGKAMVEINAYSLKADGEKKVSAHFRVREFRCPDGSDAILIARELPMILEYIRARTGKAIALNSGYRTPQHNETVGGSPKSQHTYGCAADIPTLQGYTPKQMAKIAREIMPDWGGVGVYDWGIHVDVRENKADW